ncbi:MULTISPECIES: tyrosine-type recombinase/integrase [unclassified Rhodococcus (in: high G+C Gram-positive bacteria)]|uniref:tyrosine-type recombinase/integrase n=1 Tax=unclassified Rhodococcus (in: high G+C Gram-positive bacteria) TaxID=192944 RepID=UPI0024B7F317|nr:MULTISPECIES: tyrosine-type recombinase/integrase [unclassified Rhodococcus (in: high G+C Gram-positive bacteria)]MDI9959236.1 tyrosine-type recombinase/integrase [Rhodococcus sp. IEGM 1237]MDI9964776.1 tyrosine-type recombinase/integrase [Rhodococcus sp. IEGM 1251]MDV8127119.1 tyrosine-type recombinase/integrase [Rhodococcus sp. IEGM 1304]
MTARQRRSFGTVKELPSGRWRASYIAPADGVRYAAPVTYPFKWEAEAWVAAERKKIDLGTWRPPGAEVERGLTLTEYAEKWLAERTLKPRTRSLYDDLLRLHIGPGLGGLEMGSLRPATVRTWHAGLTTGDTRKAHAYALLHAICATAVHDEVLDANPCVIRKAMGAERSRAINLLTPAELAALADAMPAPLSLSVLLAGWCGLRSGEFKELRRGDVEADGSIIRVRRAVTYRDREYRVDTPKTKAGRRDVSVPPHVQAAVVAHLATHVGRAKTALLFPSKDGDHIGDWDYRRPFKAAASAIGKPELTVHDLRHVGAVLAAQVGATTAELMGRLGHATPNMAMRYQHVAAGRDADIAAKLSAMVTP